MRRSGLAAGAGTLPTIAEDRAVVGMDTLREQGAVRSRSAYEVLDPPSKAHFEARYVVPPETGRAAAATAIREVSARLWAIVPMAEQQPELAMTVKQAARYLSDRLPAGRVASAQIRTAHL